MNALRLQSAYAIAVCEYSAFHIIIEIRIANVCLLFSIFCLIYIGGIYAHR